MLEITIPESELWDDNTETFSTIKGKTILLEHSLLSISKWEMKWHKPYLSDDAKTYSEQLDYVRCMTITKDVNPLCYSFITNDNWIMINDYINDSMTAYYLSKEKVSKSLEVPTSDIIYYWMIAYNIPLECEKWHLNRLLTLIRICDKNNRPEEKHSNEEILRRNSELNEQRKRKYNTKG